MLPRPPRSPFARRRQAAWCLAALLGAAGLLEARAPGARAPGAQGAADSIPAPLRPVLAELRETNRWTLDQQVAICEIPAPPFGEAARAAAFRDRLRALGLEEVRIDAVGNVIARRAGTRGGPTVVLSAHLDTVFPESTDVRVRRDGPRLEGPGIADDCRGLAVLLAVARAFERADLRTRGTLLFVGTVGEEGAGNLRGVRHLFERELRGVDAFITLDGTAHTLSYRGVGSRRFRVAVRSPGGHSFSDFGTPSAVHALGRVVARLADLRVPREPRTTFNVGVVRGGTSVNAIASEAALELDLRSESPAALDALERDARQAIAAGVAEEQRRWPNSRAKLAVSVDTLGIRPAGVLPDTAPLVRAARAAARALGLTPEVRSVSSDANLPLSLGIPALALGTGGTWRDYHSPAESYEDGPRGYTGPQWAALLAVSLVGLAP